VEVDLHDMTVLSRPGSTRVYRLRDDEWKAIVATLGVKPGNPMTVKWGLISHGYGDYQSEDMSLTIE
jgi:hypothetical protein